MAILGILASVVLPLSRVTVKRAKELELKRDLRMIRTAIDEYKRAYDEMRIRQELGGTGYPKSLSVLVEGVDDIKSPKPGAKIRFLRRIPRDPMNPDKTIPPEESWGLRSYDSDPDEPKEGDDVYDVYSKSEEIGLDGTPYKEW
jgi:general secretion pathway protein G